MVLLSSLIGDSIILIATIKYKVIKIHKVIVTVMQHMAVCDLIQTVFRVIPVTLALISDRWVVGELLCQVEVIVNWTCTPLTLFLTCAMTTLKLITVKYPLRTGAWSTLLGHTICSALWLLSLAWCTPLLVGKLFYTRYTIHFSYIDYSCYYYTSSSSFPLWYIWYFHISFAALGIFSYTTLIVTSVFLLIVASKSASRHGQTLRWEGVITILLTVGLCLLSYLPYSVLTLILLCGVQISNTFIRVIIHLVNLNVMGNFFVYSLTMQSFRRFLIIKISELISLMRLTRQEHRQLHQRPQPHQRPVALQRQRPISRERPDPRQDPPEVQSDNALNSPPEPQDCS